MTHEKQKHLSTLPILLSVALFAAISGYAWPRDRIHVAGSVSNRRQQHITTLAERAEHEVSYVMASNRVLTDVYFRPDGKETQVEGQFIVGLGQYHTASEVEQEIIRALLYRRLLDGPRFAKIKPSDIPQWLIAGVAYRMWQPRERLQWFDVSRRLVDKDAIPTLTQLMDLQIDAANPVFFELYADPCACLIRCMIRHNSGTIPRYLRALRPNQKPSATMPAMLSMTPEQVHVWFQAEFKKTAKSGLGPSHVEDIRKRLTKLQQVFVKLEEEEGKTMPIDQALDEIDDYHVTPEFKDQFMRGCYQLRMDSPPLLATAMNQFLEAAQLLNKDKHWQFGRKIRQARRQFDAASARIESIRDYLLEHETKQHSIAQQIRLRLEQPSRMLKPLDFDKRINDYLDDFEKKLDQPEPQPSDSAE